MKILFLNHNLIGRGTYFRCMGFARELVKCGHSVDVWTCSGEFDLIGGRFDVDGVRVWRTPRWGGLGRHDGGYAPVDNLARLIESVSGGWDVVHAFDHRPNVLVPWLSLRLRRNLLGPDTFFAADWCDWWTAGGITTGRRRFAWIDRVEQRIEEGSKRIADGVTVIGAALERRALDCGVKRENLLLLPSGVDAERFPLLDKNECRSKLGLPPDRPILGFVGFSLWDLELLADAFESIQAKIPEAVLLVVGGGVEEASKDIFRKRFDVGKDVFLPGSVSFDEVPTYLGACDVQLLPMNDSPANRARLPNKLCDYLASGRPIVASNIGEGGRIVKEYGAGLAVEEGAEALANGCVELIRNNDRPNNHGERARILAETEFSYATLTKTLLNYYEQYISK